MVRRLRRRGCWPTTPLRARAAPRRDAAGLAPARWPSASRPLYASRAAPPPRRRPRPIGDRRILCDFHMHTDHSPDCDDAGARPRQPRPRARPRRHRGHRPQHHRRRRRGPAPTSSEHGLPLHVVVGSEVKTATGEVIGLYLTGGDPARDAVRRHRRGDPRAGRRSSTCRTRSTACTRSPTPRCCAGWPTRSTCSRPTTRRLYRDAYNREAERFAERYDLLAGAGSDAHVLEGLGTGCVELPPFDDAGVPAPGSGAGPDRAPPGEPALPAGTEVAPAGKEPHPGRRKLALVRMPSTDEIYERYLARAIREIEHARRRDRVLRAGHHPALGAGAGLRPPARRRDAPEVPRPAAGDPGGRRVLRPRRRRRAEVACKRPRRSIRCVIYGTNCVKCADARARRGGAGVPAVAAARDRHHGAEDHRRDGR